MSIKKNLIHELENEIAGGDSNMKYFGCTATEAEEVLKRVKSGYYDQLIQSLTQEIELRKFIKYDLEKRKISTPKEPELKEYKIHCIREDLNNKLKLSSFKKSAEEQEKYKEDINKLLTNLVAGKYDELLIGKEPWFCDSVKVEVLLEWDKAREKISKRNSITFPNYIVFSEYCRLMEHIESVNTWKDTFGSYYECHYTKHEQTPTTEEELQCYENLATTLVTKEYDWREARNVIRELNKLDIYEDYNFPHNIEEIVKCFEHNKNIVFPDYQERGECCYDLEVIRERASNLLEVLNSSNLINIYLNKDEDKVGDYIRKMITSQFNIEDIYRESYSGVSKETIKKVLEEPNNFSDYEIKNVFTSFPNRMKKDLCDLAKGVLYSLSAYHEGSNIKIYDDAINLQKALNCWNGTIYYNNYNSVRLSNGNTIYSIPFEDIESIYSAYQKEFDYYFTNSASDLEYIEGCTEIAGNVITSQIFMEGNKRTTKCLFNAMLVARGIVPPILDFCDKDLNLWEQFACNRGNKYQPAKRTILEESLKVAKYFDGNPKEISINKGYIKK